MSSNNRTNLDNTKISMPCQVKLSPPNRRRWTRWNSAFVFIFCARVFKDVLTSRESKIPRDSHKRMADDENNMSPEGLSKGAVIIDVVEKHSCLYSIDQPSLTNLIREKNLEKLLERGGVQGIATSLNCNVQDGINGDDSQDILRRTEAFGENTYHKPPRKSSLHFVWEAFKDPTTAILLVSAALSLGFGIKKHGPKEGWYDGGSIFLAVFLVISVSAISKFRKSRHFEKLSNVCDNIQIEVVRNGREQQLSTFEIVVGDVVCLKIGDQVPADGLFLDGQALHVDESCMTSEGDFVDINPDENPFLISGTKVAHGYARMLVTSVGMNTTWGGMMSSVSVDSDKTPLQDQLNELSSATMIVGSVVALVASLVYYLTVDEKYKGGHHKLSSIKSKADEVINVVVEFIVATANVAVAAIPGGLPLAFTLTLSYSLPGMMADQFMVKRFSAFETLNSVTTVCMDISGILTQSKMEVTKFWLGTESMENASSIAPGVLDLLHQAVSLNHSTTSEHKGQAFSVIPTERAILSWAESKLNLAMEQVKQNCPIIDSEAFRSENRSGVLIKKNLDGTIHVHWKGAAEQILAMCAHYYDLDGKLVVLDGNERKHFTQIIEGMAATGLQCIAFAHKQIEANHDKGDNEKRLLENRLILLGIAGLKDPCRPGVQDTVRDWKRAGVNFKVITGDNVLTARAIAMECGILGCDGLAIEGVEFRNYTDDEQKEKVDKVMVLARSSPLDRKQMVKCLKDGGHVVAVVGNGSNDVPALKEADIGLMGTQIAKANSDIILLDDNFASVVTILRWGRGIYDNIQKFTLFQLTTNIAGLVINFVTTVSARVPLAALEVFWVNLIINPLGAIGLATERPVEEQMWKPPVGRTEPLITNIMWRNLLGQALFQITVILVLQFKGESIFGVSQEVNDTLVYNTFALCQVFNQVNVRRLASMNIFEGIQRNKLFLGIVGLTITLQIVMVEFLNRFAHTERLNLQQWAACAGIAAASWPIAWLIKLIPVPEAPFGIFVRSIMNRDWMHSIMVLWQRLI